jgi:hypothetical protein
MLAALEFLSPWLLLGLAAAAIPLVLHLLSSVRAQEVYFPTLRFLRLSMEKTARRRRVQHWLLLALRSLLLALLAMALAQPLTRGDGKWLGGGNSAVVVVLDNSLSMSAQRAGSTRLSQAKAQAAALLGGEDRPTLAALLATNGPDPAPESLTADLAPLREAVAAVEPSAGAAPLARRVEQALAMLDRERSPRKAIYVFSDMQAAQSGALAELQALAEAKDVHLMLVDTSGGDIDNVGVADVRIEGRSVVNQPLAISATLINSSPAPKNVEALLRIDGRQQGAPVAMSLAPAGQQGDRAVASFRYVPRSPVSLTGQVVLAGQGDGLSADDTRHFAMEIAPAIAALIVRGSSAATPANDPARIAQLALSPESYPKTPWSIVPRTIQGDELDEAALADADAAILCEVATVNESQAAALESFVRGGGSLAIFLGPDCRLDQYTSHLGGERPGCLLPLEFGEPVGQVGLTAAAQAVDWADVDHPLLTGLWENPGDYLRPLVQRHFRVRADGRWRTLARLADGDPLMLARTHGRGTVLLCTTPASPRWSNFAGDGAKLLVPILERLCLAAHSSDSPPSSFDCDAPGRLALPSSADTADLRVELTGPDGAAIDGANLVAGPAAELPHLPRPGLYQWRLLDAEGRVARAGALAANPPADELDLARIDAAALRDAITARGAQRVYAGAGLDAVHAQLAQDANGREWWDLLLLVVILVLVGESVIANRRNRQAIPAHLNPALR